MTSSIERVFLIVLDSVGCGELPDAGDYGDAGAHTLRHILEREPRSLPVMASLGLGNAVELPGVPPSATPTGSYGRMAELSAGKDTTTGHWEMMGLVLERPFPTYPNGFPPAVVEPFEKAVGRKILGNCTASGTEIIKQLGDEHVRTGRPIVYTSADSVFQIAAHEGVVPIEQLYEWCRIAREQLQGEHAISRIIARPFEGVSGSYARTHRRHDFSLPPTGPVLTEVLAKAGVPVHGIGKIHDIFCGRGVTATVHTKNNADGMVKLDEHRDRVTRGLVFANLVDFDMQYGHRNDVRGYADALAAFDLWLGGFLPTLRPTDLVLLTADHGCDPTFPGTDHTREHVPILAHVPGRPGCSLGLRESFADVAATLAAVFGVPALPAGRSFLGELS